MKSRFLSCLSVLLLMATLGLASFSWAQPSPRLSVRQFGLQFICTADGQPDMYSWRIPEKDNTGEYDATKYRIPVLTNAELDAAAAGIPQRVSGGRTALLLDPSVIGRRVIAGGNPSGFGQGGAQLTNLNEVAWAAANGEMKMRVYSNFPPLSNFAGQYGTFVSGTHLGGPNYGRNPSRHPGFDSSNWNWTLPYDSPLKVNEKNIQAHLNLEFYLPPSVSTADDDFKFTVVLPGSGLGSIEVNGARVFSDRDVYLRLTKSRFPVGQDGKVGGLTSFSRLVRGRASIGSGALTSDFGYPENDVGTSYTLGSNFFKVMHDARLTFRSSVIQLKIYEGHTFSQGDVPLQTVAVRLPSGVSPSPDLVTVGTYQVTTHEGWPIPPGGKGQAATTAQSWWGFNRKGVLGDPSTPISSRGEISGRFRGYGPGPARTEDVLTAFNPINGEQRVPGYFAVIYGYDPVFYPDVRQVSVAESIASRVAKIQYLEPDYNFPRHYGTDVLRVLKNTNPDVPRTRVEIHEFLAEDGYDNPEVYLQPGFMDDQPLIVSQPAAVRDEEAKMVRMNVRVTARGTVAYQWRFKGQPISGATTDSYEISTVDPVNAGSYDVVIFNSKASVTSEPVEVLIANPKITADPLSAEIALGRDVTLSVVAEGTELTYQWQRNEVAIPNATQASLTLSKVADADAGVYKVVVTGKYGTVSSAPATVTVVPNLVIVQAPVGGSIRIGGRLTLQVKAVGEGPLQYQWRRDRNLVAGATSSQLTLIPTEEDDLAGLYDVLVSNVEGELTSPAATVVAVGSRPVILTHPEDVTVALGESARFSVFVSGVNHQFQWRRNGVNLKGAMAAVYEIPNVKKGQDGSYDCVVSSGQLSALSRAATLQLQSKLVFTDVPVDQSAALGHDVDFVALAESTEGTATYQWSLNGRPLTGANSSTLALKKVTAQQAGTYSVVATLGKNKVTASAQLQVLDPGIIVYKVTGTGLSQMGAVKTRSAVTGYLLVERDSSPTGVLILSSKDGRLKKYQTHPLSNLRVDVTGAAPKTELVISDVYDSQEAPAERSIIWLQGLESLVKLSSTEVLQTPKTLSGHANQLSLTNVESGELMALSKITLRAVLDTAHTLRARTSNESLEDSFERVTLEMSLNNHVEAP